jgi:antitoxin ParD1/3/4
VQMTVTTLHPASRRTKVVEKEYYVTPGRQAKPSRQILTINATSRMFSLGRIDMGSTLNLSLTDELREFIDRSCGDGTLYATPSEFVRDLLRQKKLQCDAAAARDAILEGYQDAIAGRIVAFDGDLRSLLKKSKS